MPAFQLTERGHDEYVLQGELTFATISEALKATAFLFGGEGTLRFDLQGIGRADSAGVALLVEWVRRAGKSGVGLRFAHLPAPLLAIIRVSGVEKLLPVDSAVTETRKIRR